MKRSFPPLLFTLSLLSFGCATTSSGGHGAGNVNLERAGRLQRAVEQSMTVGDQLIAVAREYDGVPLSTVLLEASLAATAILPKLLELAASTRPAPSSVPAR